MPYILLIIFMTSDGIGFQHIDSVRFDDQAGCEVGKSFVLAQLPIGIPVTLKTLCVAASGRPG
jgi:hypothetical protein